MSAPVFYYDFNSPYAYLAAMRVDDVLPIRPLWKPIAFGVMVRTLGKTPWSFNAETADHRERLADIARRAEDRGLPPVRYPEGWPIDCYSLTPLRAAVLADGAGRLREMSRELFATFFAEGRSLADVELVLDAGERAGLDREELRAGLGSDAVKASLRESTDEAIALGARGVPTLAIGDELFWGDDRLEDAAAALA